jgi:hypothetical protein
LIRGKSQNAQNAEKPCIPEFIVRLFTSQSTKMELFRL